jgi:hypothetical protein
MLRDGWARRGSLFAHWSNYPAAEGWYEALGKTADARPASPLGYYVKTAVNLIRQDAAMALPHGSRPARASPADDIYVPPVPPPAVPPISSNARPRPKPTELHR